MVRLGVLPGGHRAHSRWTREHHLDREQEKKYAAAHLEGIHADPEQRQQGRSAHRETDAHDRGDADGLERHASPPGCARAFAEARQHRRERERLDDDEQHDEEFDQFVEHCRVSRFRYLNLMASGTTRKVSIQKSISARRVTQRERS